MIAIKDHKSNPLIKETILRKTPHFGGSNTNKLKILKPLLLGTCRDVWIARKEHYFNIQYRRVGPDQIQHDFVANFSKTIQYTVSKKLSKDNLAMQCNFLYWIHHIQGCCNAFTIKTIKERNDVMQNFLFFFFFPWQLKNYASF